MTYYHFLNCVALTFGPGLIAYKALLSEHGCLHVCLLAGLAYLAAQFGQLVVLGSIFSNTVESGFSMSQEVLRTIVGALDLLGIWLVLRRNTRKLSNVAVGLGWAVTDSIITKLIPLWLGAKGQEFSYEYLQMAIDSNILLVFYIAVATLVSLLRIRGASSNSQLLSFVQLGLLIYLFLRPTLSYVQIHKTSLPKPLDWYSADAVIKLLWTLVMAGLAVFCLYRTPQPSSHNK